MTNNYLLILLNCHKSIFQRFFHKKKQKTCILARGKLCKKNKIFIISPPYYAHMFFQKFSKNRSSRALERGGVVQSWATRNAIYWAKTIFTKDNGPSRVKTAHGTTWIWSKLFKKCSLQLWKSKIYLRNHFFRVQSIILSPQRSSKVLSTVM